MTKDGPAEKGGLKARDIILKFNDRDVTSMRKLPRIVADTKVGATVNVVVWRNGKERAFKVKLGELEAAEKALRVSTRSNQPTPNRGGSAETLGLTLSTLTPDLRRQFRIKANIAGVLITKVDGTSIAYTKGIRPGDVVVEAGQDKVGSPQDILARIERAKRAGRKSLLLLVNRKGDQRFVALRLDKS